MAQPGEDETGAQISGGDPVGDRFDEDSLLFYSEETQFPLVDGLWLLWAKRRFQGKILGIGLGISLLLGVLLPSHFVATTRVMPPQNESAGGMLATLLSKSGLGLNLGGTLGTKNSGAVFQQVLRSRTLEDALINRFDLRRSYRHKLYDDTREELEERTEITEDRKSGVIAISVDDESPQRATAIAGAYVEELNRLMAELNTSSAHRERLFLEQRLASVKTDLDSAAHDFSVFSSKNTALDLKEQGRAMVEAAALLQGQLIAADTERQGLMEIYSSNNVRVRTLQAQIDELGKQLQVLGGKSGGVTELSPESGEQLYPSIRQLPVLGVTWADLYRRVKIQETVYALLTQQYELAKVQEAKELPTAQILDLPQVPERRSSPEWTTLLLTGIFASLFVGAAWVLLMERWRQTAQDHRGKSLVVDVVTVGRRKVRALTSFPQRIGIGRQA
jgi:uncharacterized protein involved in exopolysaccharide biosynthesis